MNTFSRRRFLKASGAAVALAGMMSLTGCKDQKLEQKVMFGETLSVGKCTVRFAWLQGADNNTKVYSYQVRIVNKGDEELKLTKENFAATVNEKTKLTIKELYQNGKAVETVTIPNDSVLTGITVYIADYKPTEDFNELEASITIGGATVTAITREMKGQK